MVACCYCSVLSSASSSASQIRRAAAAATRRQQLLQRLSCLTNAGSTGIIKSKGSGSLAGEPTAPKGLAAEQSDSCLMTQKPQAADWDASTRARGHQDDVAHLTSAIRALDAGMYVCTYSYSSVSAHQETFSWCIN
jgi:hypothetical protein